VKVKNPGISERHDRGTAEVSVVSLREERTPWWAKLLEKIELGSFVKR